VVYFEREYQQLKCVDKNNYICSGTCDYFEFKCCSTIRAWVFCPCRSITNSWDSDFSDAGIYCLSSILSFGTRHSIYRHLFSPSRQRNIYFHWCPLVFCFHDLSLVCTFFTFCRIEVLFARQRLVAF